MAKISDIAAFIRGFAESLTEKKKLELSMTWQEL